MKRMHAIVLAAAALALPVTTLVNAQDPGGPSMAEMMERWMQSNALTEKHKALEYFLGRWDTETRMWMAPGAPPDVTKGTMEYSWLIDGRWMQMRGEGSMMGQPITEFGVFGYDNFKQKYVSTYLNSMTTVLLPSEGNFDQSGKNLILYGPMDEPMTGEHDKMVKYVTRIQGPDRHVFEVHDLAIGEQNTKVVEVTYTRKK